MNELMKSGWSDKELCYLFNRVSIDELEDIENYISLNWLLDINKVKNYSDIEMRSLKKYLMDKVLSKYGVLKLEKVFHISIDKDIRKTNFKNFHHIFAEAEAVYIVRKKYNFSNEYCDCIIDLLYDFGKYDSQYGSTILNDCKKYVEEVKLNLKKNYDCRKMLRNYQIQCLNKNHILDVNELCDVYNLSKSTINKILSSDLPYVFINQNYNQTEAYLKCLYSNYSSFSLNKFRDRMIQNTCGYKLGDMDICNLYPNWKDGFTSFYFDMSIKDATVIFNIAEKEIEKIVNSQEVVL